MFNGKIGRIEIDNLFSSSKRDERSNFKVRVNAHRVKHLLFFNDFSQECPLMISFCGKGVN